MAIDAYMCACACACESFVLDAKDDLTKSLWSLKKRIEKPNTIMDLVYLN